MRGNAFHFVVIGGLELHKEKIKRVQHRYLVGVRHKKCIKNEEGTHRSTDWERIGGIWITGICYGNSFKRGELENTDSAMCQGQEVHFGMRFRGYVDAKVLWRSMKYPQKNGLRGHGVRLADIALIHGLDYTVYNVGRAMYSVLPSIVEVNCRPKEKKKKKEKRQKAKRQFIGYRLRRGLSQSGNPPSSLIFSRFFFFSSPSTYLLLNSYSIVLSCPYPRLFSHLQSHNSTYIHFRILPSRSVRILPDPFNFALILVLN